MPIVAVLEDDPRRIDAMRKSAKTHLDGISIEFFVSARSMLEWLATRPVGLEVISLDCDLDMTLVTDESCGTGEDVVALLARQAPEYAVVIHSSNAMRAPAMHLELGLAGYRVTLRPFRDGVTWTADVRDAMSR